MKIAETDVEIKKWGFRCIPQCIAVPFQMPMMFPHKIFLSMILLSLSPHAFAHIEILSPASRQPGTGNPTLQQKDYPCGGRAPMDNPIVYQSGESISIEWQEIINHNGWFQVFLSTNSDHNFNTQVMADVADTSSIKFTPYGGTIELPQVTCTECVLQLRQIMTDQLPETVTDSGHPEYYLCIDIVISGSVVEDTDFEESDGEGTSAFGDIGPPNDSITSQDTSNSDVVDPTSELHASDSEMESGSSGSNGKNGCSQSATLPGLGFLYLLCVMGCILLRFRRP